MSLDFTPQMVNRNDNTIIVIGTSGELARLNFDYEYISSYSKPFPTTIMSGVLFENIWIGIWIDRELQDARMAGIPLEIDWENGIGRDILRTSSISDLDIKPKNSTWQKILNAEPMGLSKVGENIIFATKNKGIYMINQEGEEIWRDHYPVWPDMDISAEMNPIVSIIEDGPNIVIWSAAGGVMELNQERVIEVSRIFSLKDKISDVKFSKEGGWFVIMHGKSIAILRDINGDPFLIETPGPVLDAFFEPKEGVWRWTGWRHDGEMKMKNNDILFKKRENIGIHISNSKILTNDGFWEDYSSS
ncbi:MAG: hypothetical protein CMB47_00040 [Euryarchaeota archaeon]|nr:hypothetical protein [Euryarchaeota archaeon]|tara:strand:- start:5402 stop:6310 length:909 start_codon:yes stop_codon:yes gene_type:complete